MALDLNSLNSAQKEAVETINGPLLVLAGAGSGKTRVLTYRIANILESTDTAPWEILAITFTNKAAKEMRERLYSLIGARARGMWVSTFHSMAVRILRDNAELLGFDKNFTIYDDGDSKRLVASIMADMDLDPKRWPINAIRNKISSAKNELMVPQVYESEALDPPGRIAARVYHRLQERLKAANAFDFDDLLLYTYLLFKHHPEVLSAYQKRFRYLLVDEYQDTNHAQYEICRQLAAGHNNIMVVGDDDQSIYSWRGADIRNILEFENDYPNTKIIKLEENYRSVGNILDAANAVIANNLHRKAKKLFTSGEAGELIQVYQATDERAEGSWIAGKIEKFHIEGLSYDAIAVFYRTNAQSRVLEDMMLRAGIPYRIVGGIRFFERREIQDVMAYVTLALNPADDMAAQRIINVPRRGIGKTTVDAIEAYAALNGCSFMTAAELLIADESLRPATRQALASFVALIKEIGSFGGELRAVIEMIIEKSGLIASLEEEATDEAQSRIENIKEFLGVVDEYVNTHKQEDEDSPKAGFEEKLQQAGIAFNHEEPEVFFAAPGVDDEEGTPPARVLRADSLADFHEWVRLRTDLDTALDGQSAVTLMTVHGSKGLEFDTVFVTGMEESIFPHGNSSMDAAAIEEERRLAYVAITRAKRRLFLTCTASRQLYGRTSTNAVSRFIGEIPESLRSGAGLGSSDYSGSGWEKRGSRRGIAGSGTKAARESVSNVSSAWGSGEKNRSATSGFSAPSKAQSSSITFVKGDRVEHKTFGKGRVTQVDGDTVSVLFDATNKTKKLLKDFAPIVKIS